MIDNFSYSFNERQISRKAVRAQEREAKAEGYECAQYTSCATAKSNLDSLENNHTRSVRKKSPTAILRKRKPQLSMGKINPGTVNSQTGRIDFSTSVEGGSALINPERFFQNQYNDKYDLKHRRVIKNQSIASAIQNLGTVDNNTSQLITLINSKICNSSADCTNKEICRKNTCVVDKEKSNQDSYITIREIIVLTLEYLLIFFSVRIVNDPPFVSIQTPTPP